MKRNMVFPLEYIAHPSERERERDNNRTGEHRSYSFQVMLSAKMDMDAEVNCDRKRREGIYLTCSGISSIETETFLWGKLHLKRKHIIWQW